MRAVVLHEFGPAENLRYETVPDPVPGPGQVRIAVKAAGVHQIETAMREGLTIGPPLPALPTIFGGEVAGVVDAVGPEVDPSWVGVDVVTRGGQPGGYAELAVGDVARLHRIPGQLGYEGAVSMVATGGTTVGFLDVANLTADDVVLVTSAAGGIGWLVVQYARKIGAKVVGAAGGTRKVAAVRDLGADLAVDYNAAGWADAVWEALGGQKVTAVLDGVGGDKARAAFDLLADGGRFLTIGASSRQDFEPDPEALKERNLTYVNALLELLSRPEERPEQERRALAAAADGSMVPAYQTFPLSEAATAHIALRNRATAGKVLLIP